MKKRRILAVLALAVVGVLSITAWVVIRSPTVQSAWFDSERMYAANRGEIRTPLVAASRAAGPSSEQIYAANRGEIGASGK